MDDIITVADESLNAEDSSDVNETETVVDTDADERVETEAQTDDPDELETLRAEVDQLRARLEEERAVYSRMNEECREFAELYPSVPLSTLSDGIWDSVKRGVPIAAAYALEERRAMMADMKASEVNRANRDRSSGSIDSPTAEEYYTPDEVRAMTPRQVRENYTKIISSMSKWH